MRIVGGKFRGRRLNTPASDQIRPTADRTRESLFNILTHKFDFAEARVMDVFAGTGALGIEALSRGASFVMFVEENSRATALLRSNIEAFALQDSVEIRRQDATKMGSRVSGSPFDLVFLDPPYGKQLGERTITALLAGNWLKPGALAILEEGVASLPLAIDGFSLLDSRRFGQTAIAIFKVNQAG